MAAATKIKRFQPKRLSKMAKSADIVHLHTEPSAADASRLGYVGRKPSSTPRDSDGWFTPPEYIQSARAVMDGIDLDPFSSAIANETVKAKHYFSESRSAMTHDWSVVEKTRVFMNPPYSSSLITRAVNRFIEQWQQGAFDQGIVLVNNATDTRWFKTLARHCGAICFTDHRIGFWNADNKRISNNTRGQAFFYFGNRRKKFSKEFRKHGFVVVPDNDSTE